MRLSISEDVWLTKNEEHFLTREHLNAHMNVVTEKEVHRYLGKSFPNLYSSHFRAIS